MKIAKNEDMKTEFSIFTDIWNFFKKFYFIEDNDAFWSSVISEAESINEKYKDNKFCRDLILASLSEMERRNKESSNGNYDSAGIQKKQS